MKKIIIAYMCVSIIMIHGQCPPKTDDDLGAKVVQAYIFGYPLVLMRITKEVSTNVATSTGKQAPVNQFVHATRMLDASFKQVVSPNVDTLYSSAWLDLRKEPIVLHLPDTHGRYYVMQMLDAWTNVFADPGKRTTGTQEQYFVIVGPNWHGTLPNNITPLHASTDTVWIIGRTQCNGPDDCAAVQKIQEGYTLTPLSSFGKTYKPAVGMVDSAVNMTTPPVQQVAQMNAQVFFSTLAHAMAIDKPAAEDAAMVQLLHSIGVVPGKDFVVSKDNEQRFNEAVKKAQQTIAASASSVTTAVNGWHVDLKDVSHYGTNYLLRACIALVGLGINLVQDAVYYLTNTDNSGKQLQGNSCYKLHFAANALPPARAFWSLTMYNKEHFLVANDLNRYALGSRDELIKNTDGSLDIIIQHAEPHSHKANWLPSPKEEFNLILRLYWPAEAVLKGTWQPPAIIPSTCS